MKLPHTQEFSDLSPDQAITKAKEDSNGMFFYAVSEDFYDAENYDLGTQIFPKYEDFYQQKKKEIEEHLKKKSVEYGYDDSNYPDWAVGAPIAVWEEDGIWLRVEYEDRECPIMVALAIITE